MAYGTLLTSKLILSPLCNTELKSPVSLTPSFLVSTKSFSAVLYDIPLTKVLLSVNASICVCK